MSWVIEQAKESAKIVDKTEKDIIEVVEHFAVVSSMAIPPSSVKGVSGGTLGLSAICFEERPVPENCLLAISKVMPRRPHRRMLVVSGVPKGDTS